MKQWMSEEFTPGQIWAFWFLIIAMGGVFLDAALVSELGMAWGWGYAIIALSGGSAVGVADFQEWREEDRLQKKKQRLATRDLQEEITNSRQLQMEIDEELNGSS